MTIHAQRKFMKKSFVSKFTVALLVLTLVLVSLAFVGCNETSFKVDGGAKNVILLIGDGMGLEHLEATKAYYELDSLYMESMTDYHGEATTACRSNAITDSSAASTALSCGVKTDLKKVARVDDTNVENMDEYVKKYNMDMGIVVTEKVTGGTPSAFASHAYDRSNTSNIFNGYMASGVDIFVSQYSDVLNEDRENAIIENGFVRFNSVVEMTENAKPTDKIFTTDTEFAGYGEEGASLVDASVFAINHLDKMSDNGFFLMIESSHIDKHAHDGITEDTAFEEVAKEIRAFDETVKAVIEWAKQDGDTIVIITADHETGGLVYNPGDQFGKNLFTSDDHSGVNVGVFIYGLKETDLTEVTVLDNTEINAIMRQYIANKRK